MKTRITSIKIAVCLFAFATAAVIGVKVSSLNGLIGRAAQKPFRVENRLVVHEWGTFTSIAGKDGIALEWRPLNGPTDLPKFVHTLAGGGGLRHPLGKGDLTGSV